MGIEKIEKRCYFFAVKWEFDKMGIFTKMLTVWVKMGSHFIATVLYVPGEEFQTHTDLKKSTKTS